MTDAVYSSEIKSFAAKRPPALLISSVNLTSAEMLKKEAPKILMSSLVEWAPRTEFDGIFS